MQRRFARRRGGSTNSGWVQTVLAGILLTSPASASEPALDGLQAQGHDDTYLYRLPYGDDASFAVLQAYGSRFSHRGAEHYTLDFRMQEGTPVLSAREGVVVDVENAQQRACWTEGCGRFANHVVVRHSDGTLAKYFHLATHGVVVRVGEHVERGQLLGCSGNTGLTTTPHLHFGVYVSDRTGELHSIPVRFSTRSGAVELRQGQRYLHPLNAGTLTGLAHSTQPPPHSAPL